MEETTLSPYQRLFLSRAETLKEEGCHREHNEYSWNEFRLIKQPETLKEFLISSSRRMEESLRIIWIREGAFVCLGRRGELPQAYEDIGFLLTLETDSCHHDLFIHSSTLEEAISGLDFLAGLQDDHCKEMTLQYIAAYVMDNLQSALSQMISWRKLFDKMKVE
jgi:hypothetical protein